MNSSVKQTEPPFVADGGLPYAPSGSTDPFAALDELMRVVEALCPEWPERPPFSANARMLL